MKKSSSPRVIHTGSIAARILAAAIPALVSALPAQAQNTAINNNTFTGAIGTAGNWSPATVPTVSNDAVFTGTPFTGIRTFNSGTLTFGSLDVTATSGTYTIRNENTSEVASMLTLGGSGNLGNGVSGASASDLIYVNSGAKLNLTATGGTNGIGVFGLVLGQSGNFNIAGSSTISSMISDGGSGHAITKTGAGTLTLSGENTYSGDTTVNAGTLVLAGTGGLTFVVTDASSNRLTGTGSVTLEGGFTIDTAGVTATTGSWTLVNTADLAESFADSFHVTGEDWVQVSNVWTKTDATGTWTFSEATGVLALALTGGSTYDTWARTTYGLSVSRAGFDFDDDNDGIANGLEWILGGNPTHHDTPSILPSCTGGAANGLTLVFSRASASIAESTLVVEWGGGPGALSNNIIIGADVPANGDEPTVAIDVPVAGQVAVTIPAANASGGKLFARLRATHH